MRSYWRYAMIGLLAWAVFLGKSSEVRAAPRTEEPLWRHTVDGWEDAAYWQTEKPTHREGAPLEWAAFLGCTCAFVLIAAQEPSSNVPAPVTEAPAVVAAALEPADQPRDEIANSRPGE